MLITLQLSPLLMCEVNNKPEDKRCVHLLPDITQQKVMVLTRKQTTQLYYNRYRLPNWSLESRIQVSTGETSVMVQGYYFM
jgi:hypothetical protein